MPGERKYAPALGAHVEAMEYLAHVHREKGHRHSVVGDAVRPRKMADLHAMAYYIGRKRNDRDQDPLICYADSETSGKNAVGSLARRAIHDVRFAAFKAEGERREAVGYQVYEQQVYGV